MKVLKEGYGVLFVSEPSLSAVLVPLRSYSPSSIKGNALLGEIAALIASGFLSPGLLVGSYALTLFVQCRTAVGCLFLASSAATL